MSAKSWKYISIVSLCLIQLVVSNPLWVTAGDNTTFLIEIDQKAVKDCNLRSSQLVTIDSAEKNNLVKEILLDNILKGYNLWIGGKTAYGDRGQRDVPPFYWFYRDATKQEFSYTYWAEGQPDNNRYIEHCVHILENSYPPFAWKDDSCQSAKFGYICEIKFMEESGEQQNKSDAITNEDYYEQSSEQNVASTSSRILTEDMMMSTDGSTTEINSDSNLNLTWSHFPSFTSSSI